VISSAVVIAVGNIAHQSQLIYNRPRAMLPALGKPLVVRIMDRLHSAGIQKYTVVVGEDEGAVAAYLNQHWVPNVSVEFVIQSKKQHLAKTLADIARQNPDPFVVTSYNSFTHVHFVERLLKANERESGDSLMITGASAGLSRSPGEYFVTAKGTNVAITHMSSREALVLTDLAICRRDFIRYLVEHDAGHTALMAIFQAYTQSGGAASLVGTSWALQIETDYDLLTLNKHLLDEEQDAHILSELPSSVQIIPPVRIDPQVSVGQNARIGPHVYLESGCSIGARAALKNALILGKSIVSAGDVVSDAIVATRATIRA
jgi:NDP-sugar pyrophosphorylase family protein